MTQYEFAEVLYVWRHHYIYNLYSTTHNAYDFSVFLVKLLYNDGGYSGD